MTSAGLGLTESQDISQEELDFSDLFLYHQHGEDFPAGCDKDDPAALFHTDNNQPPLLGDHHIVYVSSSNLSSHNHNEEHMSRATFDSAGPASRPGTIPAPSPRIEITPSGDSLSSQTLEPSPGSKALGVYRECVSPASSNSSTGWPAESYSPVASPCVSPSVGGGCSMGLSALDLCPGLQGIHTSSAHSSPGASPRNSLPDRDAESFLVPQNPRAAAPLPHQRSRSASPHGKRSYDLAHPCQGGTPVKQRSRSPSPIPAPSAGEKQASRYLLQCQAQAEIQARVQASSQDLLEEWNSDPSTAVPYLAVRTAHGQAQAQDCVYGDVYDWAVEQERNGRAGAEVKSEAFYTLRAVWPPPPPPPPPPYHAAFSALSVAPLPSLEWPLPSQSGPYELRILQQPRSYHRAHYETEGSRGAVKTTKGGHPEVQLRGYQGAVPLGLQVFIGTADERILKPHAFYQVHRITGKTVTTLSMERMIHGTKVLEIPLEPNNHMRVMIDCAGILKLRNADIELRNGETDIGRKNTRVRLVFRVHVPQSGGQLVSLQVASEPIECSQRSAQELPAVERQDLDRCSVHGGQQMVLTGQNFTPDSKVVFSEKTQDGKQIWEVEATVDKDKTQASMLFVEVPPYRDRAVCHPAKVNFYVVNGKKKRSQPQHFIYTPAMPIKAEPPDDFELNSYGYINAWSLSGLSVKSLYHHLEQDNNLHTLNVSPALYHLATVDPRACVISPDPLHQPSANHQARPGPIMGLQHSSPVLYPVAGQQYSNSGAALPGGFPMVSHAIPTPGHCVSAKTPVGKPAEGEACLMSGQRTTLSLGKSPPSRYIQGEAQGKARCRAEAGAGTNEEWSPERVTVKQENLSYAYLEDVNDIIKRDLKGHDGD